jgi:transposase-like protein
MRCRKTWSMEEKVRFVLAWERGELTMAELCRQERVSRRSGYGWLERYAAGGLVGLQPCSRAPLQHPHAVSEEIAAAVLAARAAHPTWGPKKLRVWLQAKRPGEPWPAASTMGALLSRHGLSVPRRRRHRVPPRTQPLAACVGANDGWAADFKSLPRTRSGGWFRTGDGSRCEPFTLSDSASRYLLRCQAVPAIAADQVWPVLEAAFREYGLPRVLRTDWPAVCELRRRWPVATGDPADQGRGGAGADRSGPAAAERPARAAASDPAARHGPPAGAHAGRAAAPVCRLPAGVQRGAATRGVGAADAGLAVWALAAGL